MLAVLLRHAMSNCILKLTKFAKLLLYNCLCPVVSSCPSIRSLDETQQQGFTMVNTPLLAFQILSSIKIHTATTVLGF